MSEKVCFSDKASQLKDAEMNPLKQRLNEFVEERQGWLQEIDRKQAALVASQLLLEQLRQQEQLLTAENDMLKTEVTNHKKKVAELEGEVKQLSAQQNLQQRIHHHAKIKEENNVLRVQKEDLIARLRRSENIVARFKQEVARYRASSRSGRNPYINFDEEKRLSDKLMETEEERLHLAQKLVGLCTSILKVAGVTKPASHINLSAAEEALEQLVGRITSMEREIDDIKLKDKITTERIRLSEHMPQSSPLSARAEGSCGALRIGTQTPFLSSFDR